MGRWLDRYREKISVHTETGTDKTSKSPFWQFWQCDSLEDSIFHFCRLVRHMGTSFGVVLDDELILAELNARDIEYLQQIDTAEKQVWAELLSYRLAKEWKPRRLRK